MLIEPANLRVAQQEDPAQHELGDALRMRLGIRERERRAPRSAEHLPAGDGQMVAQPFDVGDEVPCGVGVERGVGLTLAAASLIEVDDAVPLGWKKRRCFGSDPPPGPPWRKITGLPLGLPLSSK